MLSRRRFIEGITGLGGLGLMSYLGAQSAVAKKRPNIVFFLVDDLGWGDFGCYDSTLHETPNIDRLARDGMKFTCAYASAPVCSPSRAAIVTGQWPARLHLTQWIPGQTFPHKKLIEAPTPDHLDPRVPTIAQQLKRAGYQTAAIGKWHLGGDGFLPEDFGFDVNIAGDNSGNPHGPNHYFGPFHYHHLNGYTEKDYLTDVLTQKMEEYVLDAAKKGPFFLYMSEYAVHLPLGGRKELIAKYEKKNGGTIAEEATYAAMVESVDTALGMLRATLEKAGVADNTIIILTSDNGGVRYQGKPMHDLADNGPFRAGKGFLYEGGIREPLIVHWPGVTRPGSVCDTPVIGTDFVPTILSMTDTEKMKAPADGLDFTPLLHGGTAPDRDTLYWHYPHYHGLGGTPSGAIREGNWKLIEFFEDGHLELYNLGLDPGERFNFASLYDDRAEAMRAKLDAWRTSVNAVMPQANPDYKIKLADALIGPPTCDLNPRGPCLYD